MSLTAIAIKNARPQAKPYKLTDERALFLLVMPNGAKYWRMQYRHLGKQKTLSLGVWPEVTLAEAREKRDAARKQIADGLDPAAEKKLKRIRAQIDSSVTFKAIAEEWVLKCEREERAKRTLEKIRWLLDMAYPLRIAFSGAVKCTLIGTSGQTKLVLVRCAIERIGSTMRWPRPIRRRSQPGG
jgi:hypothetical protein